MVIFSVGWPGFDPPDPPMPGIGYNPPVDKRDDIPFAKVIATVGPATREVEMLTRLIDEGVRVFRINFSHGNLDQFDQTLENIRAAAAAQRCSIGVLGDLSGPKIRLGRIAGDGLELHPGDRIELLARSIEAADAAPDFDGIRTFRISTNYPKMIGEVEPGHRLLIDDGNVRLLAVERHGNGPSARLACRVTTGGHITTAKGLNLPDTQLQGLSAMTDWDRQCLAWAMEVELDYLALSFVRRAEDVLELKRELVRHAGEQRGRTPVIAKIEKPQALGELTRITEVADGIMVARGDLGVEMDLAEVPVAQKRIIAAAHDLGKPVIVATQMLQSMIENPHPTRAEVSDVANAIFDGADAVMLSGETAIGHYPVQTVQMMSRIARTTQPHLSGTLGGQPLRSSFIHESRYRTAALARGVSAIVRELGAKMVVTWSQLGGSARYLSKSRLMVPVIAASSNPAALRRTTLLFAVQPVELPQPANVDAFLEQVDELVIARGWAGQGDPIVILAGDPIGTPGVTNRIHIHYVGDACRLGDGR